jgi:transposase-like protein
LPTRNRLAERGATVDHVTVYRWAQRFTPGFIEAARLVGMFAGTGGSLMRLT